VAPTSAENQLKVYKMWEPVMKLMTPEAKEKIFKTNFHRVYDTARKKVGEWEKKHMNDPLPKPKWSPAAGLPPDFDKIK
jgi:hypothetical protein